MDLNVKNGLVNDEIDWHLRLPISCCTVARIEIVGNDLIALLCAEMVVEVVVDMMNDSLVVTNLRLRGGRVLWEARGAWKHVVPLARFARHPSNALNRPGSSRARFSARWSAPEEDRKVPGGMRGFFSGNPAWA